jgi:hypothetical protein
LPVVAVGYQLLIFRLVFGFGKFKFTKTNLKERLYLKSFVINQPLPTPAGWYASHLPGWVAILGQGFLFIVEIVLPFFIFFTGDFRILAAFGIVGLMLGIQLMGNYGFFNVLVISLCVTLLDSQASIFSQSLSVIFASVNNLMTGAVMVVLFVGGLLYLPFNSWCTQSWLYWPPLAYVKQSWLQRLIAFYRGLAPWRVVHAYGVFPPNSSPPIKWIPIIEGTADGKEWKAYHYRFLPSSPSSPPRFIAPYHPRLDHNIFYEAFGSGLANFTEPIFSIGNPYHFAHTSGVNAIVQRLLEGDSPVANLFANTPFRDTPPKSIRVSCYMLETTTPDEKHRTGHWWRMRYVGPHLPPATLNNHPISQMYPDPELFHWDQIIWKERSPKLKAMMTLAQSARSTDSILLQTDLTTQDLDCFWNAFVVSVRRIDPEDWRALPQITRRLRRTCGPEQFMKFEKIFARLSLILYARLKPYYFGQKEPKLELKTFFHFGLMAYSMIVQGRDTFERALNDPACAISLAKAMRDRDGLFYLGIFWSDVLVFHARKCRLVDQFNPLIYEPALSGFTMLIPFIKEQFFREGEESLPIFIRRIRDGMWLTVDEDNPVAALMNKS